MRPLRPWRTASRTVLYQHRLFRLEERELAADDGARRAALVLDVPGWLNVVAITGDDQMVLVRQWRFGTEAPSLELPGGTIEPGEDPAVAAHRELLEETGYAAGRLELLATIEPNPAIQNNHCHLFRAHDLRHCGAAQGDGEEEIEVVLVPPVEVVQLVRAGAIRHSLVLCALYHLSLRDGSLGW